MKKYLILCTVVLFFLGCCPETEQSVPGNFEICVTQYTSLDCKEIKECFTWCSTYYSFWSEMEACTNQLTPFFYEQCILPKIKAPAPIPIPALDTNLYPHVVEALEVKNNN